MMFASVSGADDEAAHERMISGRDSFARFDQV